MTKNPSPTSADQACQRPATLYRYSRREWLERSLQYGEFRLQPAPSVAAQERSPGIAFGVPPAASAYLTLSLAHAWDDALFARFGGDCCLVIHEPEQFGERIHRAAQRLLPSWAGIDAGISYGVPSPLGAAFTKHREQAAEQEWLFAWRPMQKGLAALAVTLAIGSIEGIAELKARG
ncbi:MAG TPA: hypothetical protein VIM12_16110 [Noviherbaspirillum sp.]|uniref:hypothetical protein n=1 Tax=Noviherbaspirillum sp. TaxID=1926288 RepID=UPI002F94C6A6